MIALAVIGWLLTAALAALLAALCLMCLWLRLAFPGERGLLSWILTTGVLSAALFYYVYTSSPFLLTLRAAQ